MPHETEFGGGHLVPRLAEAGQEYRLLSVLREPLWRCFNLARGKYLRDIGNTPGDLQTWSRNAFCSFVRRRSDIVEAQAPLPWTMFLCQAKHC